MLIPKYMKILPMYSGFLTYAKGPCVTRLLAPTFPVVLVSLPAYVTPQKRISSPSATNITPETIDVRVGRAYSSMGIIKISGV
jgi:hypothetical protein